MAESWSPSEAELDLLLRLGAVSADGGTVEREPEASMGREFKTRLRRRLMELHLRGSAPRDVASKKSPRRRKSRRWAVAVAAALLVSVGTYFLWPVSAGVPGFWPPGKMERENMGLVGPVKTVESGIHDLVGSVAGGLTEVSEPRSGTFLAFDREGRLVAEVLVSYAELEEDRWRRETRFDQEGRRLETTVYPPREGDKPWVYASYAYSDAGCTITQTEFDASGAVVFTEVNRYTPSGVFIGTDMTDADGSLSSYRVTYDREGRQAMSEYRVSGRLDMKTIDTYDASGRLAVSRTYYGPTRILSSKTVYTYGPEKGKVLERCWNYGTNGALAEGYQTTEEYDAMGNWVVRTRLLVEPPQNTSTNSSWTAYHGEVQRRTITYYVEQTGG